MRWEKGEACWKTWGGIVEWLDELGWLAEELDGVENLLRSPDRAPLALDSTR